jgi:flagellar FliL protein
MADESDVDSTGSNSPSTASPPPSGGSSKFVIILALINSVATIGMLMVMVMNFKKDKEKPVVEDISTTEEVGEAKEGDIGSAAKSMLTRNKNADKMVPLDQFTINLSNPGSVSPKFARVNITLAVPNDDTESEITLKTPQVRNVIIDLFNSKRPTDLATVDGREYIKEEIKNAINSFLVNGKLKGVFFTNFALSS